MVCYVALLLIFSVRAIRHVDMSLKTEI